MSTKAVDLLAVDAKSLNIHPRDLNDDRIKGLLPQPFLEVMGIHMQGINGRKF